MVSPVHPDPQANVVYSNRRSSRRTLRPTRQQQRYLPREGRNNGLILEERRLRNLCFYCKQASHRINYCNPRNAGSRR